MTVSFELHASARADVGKGASRRLRHAQKVPGIIYGKGTTPLAITLDHKKVLLALQHEAFYSHILTVLVDGKPEKVVLKDIHRHPYKAIVLHMDFQRVNAATPITLHVPLHFLHESQAPGLKEGGLITKQHNEVEIRCLPQHLPEYIEVDCSTLHLDGVIHLSEIPLPKGVELMALAHGTASHDYPVVSIHRLAVVAEDAAADEAEAAAAEDTSEMEGDATSEAETDDKDE